MCRLLGESRMRNVYLPAGKRLAAGQLERRAEGEVGSLVDGLLRERGRADEHGRASAQPRNNLVRIIEVRPPVLLEPRGASADHTEDVANMGPLRRPWNKHLAGRESR